MQRGPALWVLGCESPCHHPAQGFKVSGWLDRYLSAVRGSQVRVAPSFSMRAGSVAAHKMVMGGRVYGWIDIEIEEVPCSTRR